MRQPQPWSLPSEGTDPAARPVPRSALIAAWIAGSTVCIGTLAAFAFSGVPWDAPVWLWIIPVAIAAGAMVGAVAGGLILVCVEPKARQDWIDDMNRPKNGDW